MNILQNTIKLLLISINLCLFCCACTANGIKPTEIYNSNLSTAPIVIKTATPTSKPEILKTLTPISNVQFTTPNWHENQYTNQERKKAVLELLETNGNCSGKCLAGIRPDDMTFQEGVNIMSKWESVEYGQNHLGEVFANFSHYPQIGNIKIRLTLGTWSEKFETIDDMRLVFSGVNTPYISKEEWEQNIDLWQGFSLENILKTYGPPSSVDFHFRSYTLGDLTSDERDIEYGMSIQFEKYNVVAEIVALAQNHGEVVSLCPTRDTRYLIIEINPEKPITEKRNVYPVSWIDISDTDLFFFMETYTNGSDPNYCVSTSIAEIISLQGDLR